jgi:hypothetical protein
MILYQYHNATYDYDLDKVEAEKNNLQRYLEVALPFYSKLGKPQECKKELK